jgi:hypothetical protein
MEKSANMAPVNAAGAGPYLQNAIKFRFAALSISSIPIRTRIALRRINTPARPMEKRSEDKSR